VSCSFIINLSIFLNTCLTHVANLASNGAFYDFLILWYWFV
jgi:hypothetical protein